MPEFDEFGIPIRSKSKPTVDEFGIPIKKKEPTASPSQSVQKPSSSATQGKKKSQPSVSSYEVISERKLPDGSYQTVIMGDAGKGRRAYAIKKSPDGRESWYEYSHTSQAGDKWLDIYDKPITDPSRVSTLNKKFGKKASTVSNQDIFTGFPNKEENEYRVDKLVNGQEVWSVRRKGQEEFTVISDEGSISALNRQFGKSVKPSEDAKKKREAQITRQQSYTEFKDINTEFVGGEEEEAVVKLRNDYGKLGFKFDETGKGDQVRVTASNGKQTIINLDNWTDETDRENARNLRKFLQENQQLGDYVDLENEEIKKSKEKYLDITKVDFDEQRARLMSAGSQKEFEKAKEENAKEIASKPIAELGAEARELREKIVTGDYNRQQRIADLSRVANTEEERKDLAAIAVANRDSFVQKNKINDKYVNDLALSRKDVVNELSELNKEIERVNSSQSSMTEEEYNSEMSRLKTEYDDLIIKDNQINSDINKVYTIEEQNQKDAALYFAYNEQQGSVGGGLWNSFVKGVFGFTGLVDPDAPDFFAKMLGSEMTTEEFMQSEDRWDITKASFSVAESVGALAAAVLTGGTTKAAGAGKILTKSAETLPFFSMSYNEIKSEMDSEEFKGIPSWQKEGLAIIYGLGVGYLDKLSITFGATGKIPQAISKGIIFRAISGLGKDATTDAIERAIASQFKKDIAAGLIKIAGGNVLEGATEGVQSLYGSALKAGFNWMQGKDENGNEIKPFDVSNWAKDALYEAYMGALGGTIMSVPSGAVRGIKNGFNRLSPSYMEMTKKVIEDSNLRSMLITDIKTKLMSGKITKDEAQEQINAIKEASGLFAKMPDNLSPEGVAKSTDLLIERSKIEKEIAGKEDNLVVAQKARIAEINNELQTISQNAVKESTKPVEEGPAEGGGVQYQGTQEGQPEVREGERPVGETAQPEADLGNRAVEGRSEAEVTTTQPTSVQPTTRQVVNRPATLSEYGGTTFDSPLKGDVYVEGQQVVFEDRATGRIYELGNVDQVIDTQVPGLNTEQERISITREGKVSIDGNNWNIQSELPTQGIEYTPAGEVMRVSLKDDTGRTAMFDGQDAIDIAYQIELQKYQTPEQQQFINELLEQDEEFKQATANIKPAEAAAVVQEEAAPDTVPVAEKEVDDEVSRLEEFFGKKTPKFQKGEQKGVTEEEVDKIVDEMNGLPDESANFDVPSDLTTKNKMNIGSLISRFGNKLKGAWKGGVIKDISEFNGIPFIFTISDQLASGNVKNPLSGGTIDLNGGLGFNLTEGNENNAWANTDARSSKDMYNRAVSLYEKNKDLFDRLWADGKLPNGHIPMAVVKMGPQSIKTNEALFRAASDIIKSKFNKKERENSLKGLIGDIGTAAVTAENNKRKKDKKPELTKVEAKSVYDKAINESKTVAFIKDNNFKTIDELLDNMNSLKPIGERVNVTNFLFTGGVEFDKTTTPGIPRSKSGLALVGDKDSSFYKYIHLQTINNIIQEEASGKIPPNHVIAIVGVDVVNGGVTSVSNGQVVHRNYPYGVKGQLIGVLENPVHAADVFPEMHSKIFAMMKPDISGNLPSVSSAISQAVAVSGSIVTTKAFIGSKLSNKMTDLQKLTAKLKLAFPNVTIVDTQQEFEKALQDPNVKQFVKDGEVVYGFTSDGKVFLNPDKANANTAIHEFAHVWMGFLRENNPKLLQKGFQLLEGTSILKRKIAEMGNNELAREEAMAELIANRGDTIIEAGIKSKFKNWLNAAFGYIKSKFKAFDKLSPEEFQNISLNEFIDGSLASLLGGEEVTSKQIKSLQVMFSKTNKIDDIISIARENGFSDAAIKKYLEKSGFDQKDINAAMKQRKAPSVSKILGKPAPKKVTVNEAAALKDQLRLEARAARQSSQSLKQKQRQLIALINEMKRGGIVTAQQASALAKRVVMTNVDNPIMVERTLQYAERLFERADYQQKLQEANSLQKKIKSKLKSKGLQASVVSVAKDFSKIQPWMLSDIDAYIEQANNVLNAVRPSRQTADLTVDIRTAMSLEQVGEYVENANKEIEEYRKAEILAVNDDLVAAGVISKDMNLNEILEIINELKDPSSEIDPADKKAAILAYIGSVMDVYRPIVESMINGKDAFTGEGVELTDRQKEVASDMMKIDVTKMDIRDAVQVIEAMDNFITNGIIDGVEAITNTYNGQRNAEKVAAKGFKTKSVGAGKVGNLWAYNMMSLPVLSDWIFRGTNRAQYVLDNIGINKFIKGVAQATSRWRKYTDEYYEAFTDEKLFLKISPIKVRVWKKANGKDFMDPENIYERGMYAFLKRTVTGDQKAQEKELKRKIKLIKDSVDVLREEGDAKDAKVADMYDMLIEKLGLNDANLTISDIESRVDKLNIDAVNWWVNTWADNYSQLADVSQSVYNTILDKDMFYTPDKFSSLDPNNSENVDELMNKMGGGGFASVLNYEYDKKTGVLMPSSKPVSMEQKRYVNLNFDNNNQRALKAALIDINTAAATKQIKGFFKSKSWNKVITNKSDRDLFRKRVDEYILRSRNKQVGTDDQTIGEVERSLRIWASMGATRALGSIFQPFKQTIPIFVNTLMNAGKHTTFAFGRDQHRWIDAIEMPISNRGIESIAAFDDADAALDRSIAAGKIEKALDVVEKVNTKWLKLVLAKPDVFAARSAFIAYYKKALEAKGKSTDIDYNNPADVDQEALNYAQHMVDRQQNASDAMLMGDLFTSGQSLKKIMKNTLFPFMSFVVNQKSRMTTDVSIMFSGDASRADRKAAARSLGGLILEMAAFHSLSFAIKYYIVSSIASAIGGEDEPEEEDVQKSLERQLSYTIGTVAKDIFSPVPLFTDSPVIYGADFLMKKIAPSYMEDDAKEALKTENEARELSGKPALEGKKAQEFIDNYIEERRIKASQYDSQGPGGVYRITLDKGIEVYKSLNLAYNGEFESEGFGGKMETKYIDSEGQDKMKDIMPYYLAWSALGIPAEFGSVFRKIENNVKKENKLTEKQHEALNEVLEATGRKKEGEVEKYLVKKMRATQTESSSERVLNELDWIDSQGGLKNERQVKKYIEIFETEGSVGIRDMQEIQKLK